MAAPVSDGSPAEVVAAASKDRRPLVLIIEDHEETRTVYAACLRAEGWVVEEARDGSEGVRRALTLRPDAILLDVEMPVLDGAGAARQLRWHPATKQIPIVVVTAHAERFAEGDRKLFAHFLHKPCMTHELVGVMRPLMN